MARGLATSGRNWQLVANILPNLARLGRILADWSTFRSTNWHRTVCSIILAEFCATSAGGVIWGILFKLRRPPQIRFCGVVYCTFVDPPFPALCRFHAVEAQPPSVVAARMCPLALFLAPVRWQRSGWPRAAPLGAPPTFRRRFSPRLCAKRSARESVRHTLRRHSGAHPNIIGGRARMQFS